MFSDSLEFCADSLLKGKVGAMPTETVYGLAALLNQPQALARIFELKSRPLWNPLIVHVLSKTMAAQCVSHFPPEWETLTSEFWPGPLTLVLPKIEMVPSLVTGGSAYVGLRVPKHPLALELLNRVNTPIAAPSANRFMHLSPTRLEHVFQSFGNELDFLLDGGPCEVGLESTILGWVEGRWSLLREGGIPVEDLASVLKLPNQSLESSRSQSDQVLAPGSHKKHYAPKVPLIFPEDLDPHGNRKLGVLAWTDLPHLPMASFKEVLSPTGNLREAAYRLFDALHRLEVQKIDCIVAYPPPRAGLGAAIFDRLNRARHVELNS